MTELTWYSSLYEFSLQMTLEQLDDLSAAGSETARVALVNDLFSL